MAPRNPPVIVLLLEVLLENAFSDPSLDLMLRKEALARLQNRVG